MLIVSIQTFCPLAASTSAATDIYRVLFQVASILNILDDELVQNVGNYIQRLVPSTQYCLRAYTFVEHVIPVGFFKTTEKQE